YFALEREHIFMREWVCVGREEEFPVTGDHKVLDLYGESILLLRNEAGNLKAFYNVCRHRGARICPSPGDDSVLALKGGIVGKRSIICPYHAWTYDLDGQLIRAPFLTDEIHFDMKNVQLHPVLVETWGGFIFLNLTPDEAPPFEETIAVAARRFTRYPLADLRVAKTISYEVQANWKVLCENYNECYHCGPVHPELCRIVPAFREAGGAHLDWERGIPHREGATTFTFSGESTRRSFPGLNEDERVRHKGELVYPNLFMSLAREHVTFYILRALGPGRTCIDCYFLFEPFEMDKPDFDPSDAVEFWHLVNQQDWAICERVQQGMAARVHDRGVYAPMEDWNLDIRRYVSDRIGPYAED
ncbi:MAG: aromatic ring-hydroxylating oxygenase subunit alpha, partial [Burkholderiales bacterium]